MMQRIDLDGTVFLLDDVNGRYRYQLMATKEGWRVLLRDDGNRIESIFISVNPIDPPLGAREWNIAWEYKHCEAPGHKAMVELIMTGTVGDEA